MKFLDREKFQFPLQSPWNSIQHQVRNSPNPNHHLYNINFHVFSDYTAGKNCFLSPRPAWWCTNEASTESLWIVDSRNTTFRLAQIQVSATRALKFDRTSGSKPHNINFHVFFDYAPGITYILSSWTVFWYTSESSIESLWTVVSKNIVFRPW